MAIITLAEGMVSLAGALTFLVLVWEGKDFNFDLLLSVLTGSFLAAVISPFLVWLIPSGKYRYVVPSYAILIGLFILIKIYTFNFL